MKINRRQLLQLSALYAASGGLTPRAALGGPAVSAATRLSDSHELLLTEKPFDYLVVGSGYGGAVVSSRLAQKFGSSKSIAVIERGREWVAGEFPSNLVDVIGQLKSRRNPLGLFHFIAGRDLSVFAGSGLGGTSLINSAAAVEPQPEVFAQAPWPVMISEELSSAHWMRHYYDRVRATLGLERAPSGLKKNQLLKRECQALGVPHTELELAIDQSRCRLCGDCVTGCNFGAKRSLNTSYLSLAKRAGARVFTQVEVDRLRRLPDGYTVVVRLLGQKKEHVTQIRAHNIILSAGCLGSTGILLRSQLEENLRFSQALGSRFSANGDILGFSYGGNYQTNIEGVGARAGAPAAFNSESGLNAVGPTIVGAADYRDVRRPLAQRFMLEDGAIPSSLVKSLRWLTSFQSGGDFARNVIGSQPNQLNRSMIYLSIGHDSASGRVVLNKSRSPEVRWPTAKSEEIYKVIQASHREHAKFNGGKLLSPSTFLGSRDKPITVHPLGGCPMAETSDLGVVDQMGRVFDPRGETEVYQGLYVADGSIIPTSLGANPYMTIAALSERIADYMTGARS